MHTTRAIIKLLLLLLLLLVNLLDKLVVWVNQHVRTVCLAIGRRLADYHWLLQLTKGCAIQIGHNEVPRSLHQVVVEELSRDYLIVLSRRMLMGHAATANNDLRLVHLATIR